MEILKKLEVRDDRYEKMPYRRCGNSGIKLPAISLGLWQNFGSETLNDEETFIKKQNIIVEAFNSGITHFDLANNYGPLPGAAETFFGKVLKDGLKGHRDELIISTKAGYTMWDGPYGDWGSRKYLMASLDQSLERMGLDYVDIFYHHRFDPETPLEETMTALADIVHSGKALYVGISNYNGEQAKRAAQMLKEMGVHLLITQPRYNMFTRWFEGDLLPVLQEEGIGSIAFCPLAQGLLTNRYLNGIPASSRAAREGSLKSSQISEETLNKIRKLSMIAVERGQSMAQMALSWNLRGDGKNLTSVVIGASSIEQLDENVKAIEKLDFTDDELNAIEEILKDE